MYRPKNRPERPSGQEAPRQDSEWDQTADIERVLAQGLTGLQEHYQLHKEGKLRITDVCIIFGVDDGSSPKGEGMSYGAMSGEFMYGVIEYLAAFLASLGPEDRGDDIAKRMGMN